MINKPAGESSVRFVELTDVELAHVGGGQWEPLEPVGWWIDAFIEWVTTPHDSSLPTMEGTGNRMYDYGP